MCDNHWGFSSQDENKRIWEETAKNNPEKETFIVVPKGAVMVRKTLIVTKMLQVLGVKSGLPLDWWHH